MPPTSPFGYINCNSPFLSDGTILLLWQVIITLPPSVTVRFVDEITGGRRAGVREEFDIAGVLSVRNAYLMNILQHYVHLG